MKEQKYCPLPGDPGFATSCYGEGCGWWIDDECAMETIARTLCGIGRVLGTIATITEVWLLDAKEEQETGVREKEDRDADN